MNTKILAILAGLEDDVQTTTTVQELKGVYNRVVAALKAGNGGQVIELGTYNGRSACVLGAACLENNGLLATVDILNRPVVRRNLVRAGVSDVVSIVVKSAHDALRDFKAPVRAIFLDGDHTYTQVLWELRHYSELLAPDGIILGHDFYNSHDSRVEAAVHVFLQERPEFSLQRFGGVASNPHFLDSCFALTREAV